MPVATASFGEPWLFASSGELTFRVPPEPEPVNPLTIEQCAVLTCVSNGLTTAEIAARLGVTTGTVDKIRSAISDKLEARNAPHAVAIALRKGFIT